MKQPLTIVLSLVIGALLGAAAYHATMVMGGKAPVNRARLDEQQARIDELVR